MSLCIAPPAWRMISSDGGCRRGSGAGEHLPEAGSDGAADGIAEAATVGASERASPAAVDGTRTAPQGPATSTGGRRGDGEGALARGSVGASIASASGLGGRWAAGRVGVGERPPGGGATSIGRNMTAGGELSCGAWGLSGRRARRGPPGSREARREAVSEAGWEPVREAGREEGWEAAREAVSDAEWEAAGEPINDREEREALRDAAGEAPRLRERACGSCLMGSCGSGNQPFMATTR